MQQHQQHRKQSFYGSNSTLHQRAQLNQQTGVNNGGGGSIYSDVASAFSQASSGAGLASLARPGTAPPSIMDNPSLGKKRSASSAGFVDHDAAAFGDMGAFDDDDEETAIGGSKKGPAGRRKIKIEYIEDKSRRHITFSKRKAGIMKKVCFLLPFCCLCVSPFVSNLFNYTCRPMNCLP